MSRGDRKGRWARLMARLSPWMHWMPLMLMGVVLVSSLTAAALVSRLTHEQQQARFAREITAHTSALRGRINDFGKLLVASRAFWLSQAEPPTPQRFRSFTAGLDLSERYPDVQALGFVRWSETRVTPARLSPSSRSPLENSAADVGIPIFPAQTSQPYRTPIQFIAPPSAVNLRALGFDMYSEPLRRAAMDAGRTSNSMHATYPLQLVQGGEDGLPQNGFLLMLPVWRAPDGSAAEPRRGQLIGFVYLAVRSAEFVHSLDESYGRDRPTSSILLAGRPLLGAEGTGQSQVGQSQVGRSLLGQSLLEPLNAPELVKQPPLQLAGQTWQVSYAPPATFASEPLNWLSPLLALLGLVASGVAFLISRAQVVARESAEATTRELSDLERRQQQARAEFEAIFQAMQDAAAFTDDQGRVRLVNRAMTEQFRTPVSELVGRPLTMLHVDRRLDDRASFQAITTPYQRSDGTRFYGEAQRNEVFGPGHRLLGHLEVVRDVSERVSADQAVRDEERRSRAILDTIPHMLWVSSPQGDTTYVNTQHRDRLGGLGVRSRLDPADVPTYDQMWKEAYVHLSSAQSTVQIGVGPEGDRQCRWFEVRVAPLLDESGQVREWVASATDIHDRVLAERDAQTNEARYRGVVEGMPQIVWLADAQGQTTYFNRRWKEYVGEQRSADLIAALHPDDRDEYQLRWSQALSSGRPFEAEHRLRSERGEYRTFVTRGLPIWRGEGRVLEWVGTTTDVDDSVYAENAARLLADVTEALVVRASDPLAVRRERYEAVLGLLTSRLMEAAAIWTVPRLQAGETLPGADEHVVELASCAANPNWRLLHIVKVVRRLAYRVAVTREPEYVLTHPLLHAVEVSGGLVQPLIGLDGTLHGVLGVAHRHPLHDRDHELILELASRLTTALENDALREQAARAQQELRQLNQSLEERVQRRTLELEDANRELEAFSYSVSHDLRTPLRHIVGFGDLLRKDSAEVLPPKSQRYLGVITDAAGRMSGLIDSLLEFSRMGRQPLRLVPVNLDELVGRVWQTLEPDRQGREVQLTLQPLPQVPGDPALLELVFQNLLSNALKYSRTRDVARIEVTAVQEGEVARISVTDNGVGFDPKYSDKLFGVFQRLHRAEEFDGIGIGLANVRRIVSRHGGQVSGSSVPGEGATFTVVLPLRQAGES